MKYILPFILFPLLFSCKKEAVQINKKEEIETIIIGCEHSFTAGDSTGLYVKYTPPIISSAPYLGPDPYDTIEIDHKKLAIHGVHVDHTQYYEMTSLNDSIEFVAMDTLGVPLIKRFDTFNQICYNSVWKKHGYFYYFIRTYLAVSQWFKTEAYAAIRIKTTNGYKYGWLKISVVWRDTFTFHSYGIEA